MSLYRVSPGDRPLSSDVNQLVDALTGKAAIGAITLANQVDPPSDPPNVTVEAGGSLPPGTYKYAYTYLVGTRKSNGEMLFSGETTPSPIATVTVADGMAHVTVTTPRLGLDQTIIAKRIYRSKADGSTLHLVTTIPVEQANFVDTVADDELGESPPPVNDTGTVLRLGRDPVEDDEAATKRYVDGVKTDVNNLTKQANTWTNRQTFASGIQDGNANDDVSLIYSVQHQAHTRSTVLTYTNGWLTKVEEKDGSTVIKTTTLSYDASGRLTSVSETAGGVTVTATLVYDGNGRLVEVQRT